MKYLITYSTSKFAAASIIAAHEMQKQYPLPDDCHRVALSDAIIPGLDMETIVDPFLDGPGGFWQSRVRNMAFAAARKFDPEYLITMDSDAVFLGLCDGEPMKDFECAQVFFQCHHERITPEALAVPSRYRLSSWWIFHRRIYTQEWCRAYEGFMGYGFDDFDFLYNVAAPRGYERTPGAVRALHLWHHPKRGRNDAEFDLEFLRNKRLYEARVKALQK